VIIEKVTFYKSGSVPYKSGDAQTNYNLTPISLPRVRWLEVDGPYRPRWAVDFNPEEPRNPDPAKKPDVFRKKRPIQVRSGPLTKMEEITYGLFRTGLNYAQISEKTGFGVNSVKDAIYRARQKSGFRERNGGHK